MRTVTILVDTTAIPVELHPIPGSSGEEQAFVGDIPFAVVHPVKDSSPARVLVVGMRGGVAVGRARRVATLLNFVWGCFLREERGTPVV